MSVPVSRSDIVVECQCDDDLNDLIAWSFLFLKPGLLYREVLLVSTSYRCIFLCCVCGTVYLTISSSVGWLVMSRCRIIKYPVVITESFGKMKGSEL